MESLSPHTPKNLIQYLIQSLSDLSQKQTLYRFLELTDQLINKVYIDQYNHENFVTVLKDILEHIEQGQGKMTEEKNCQHQIAANLQKLSVIHKTLFILVGKVFLIRNQLSNSSSELNTKKFAIELSNIFQKLRFETQIFNIYKSFEYGTIINFQQLIQFFLTLLRKYPISNSLYKVIKLSLLQQNSNIPQNVFHNFNKSVYKQDTHKLKYSDAQTEQIGKESTGSLALKYIKLREKQLYEANLRGQRKTEDSSRNKYGHNFNVHRIDHLKSKLISKTRTIYHTRKNLYISKQRKEPTIYEKDKLEVSTQLSLNSINSVNSISKSRAKKSLSEFENDDDFGENVLALKTPIQNKVFYDAKPISIKLDF